MHVYFEHGTYPNIPHIISFINDYKIPSNKTTYFFLNFVFILGIYVIIVVIVQL